MKRFAFPLVMMAILIVGLTFSSSGNAARKGVSADDLLRSGHTIDCRCGTAATSGAATEAEPLQIAAANRCQETSSGACANPQDFCGGGSGKKKNTNQGVCITLTSKRKNQTRCACVK